ncbi:MAG: PspC domain-containing protein [Bacteroidota bacterium]|nr:PspC domain-containing protein [Bacteroidota bacterium]
METNGQTPRRLYKSRRNKVIDGICGGIAEYFDMDPTIVRLLWVLITLMGGSGFILYIIAMIIIPVNPEHLVIPQSITSLTNGGTDKRRFFGVMLILLGALILMLNMGWFWGFGWWSFSYKIMLPILFIIIGIFFIYIHTTKKSQPISPPNLVMQESFPTQLPPVKELRRSKSNRKLFGVCGGIAYYFDIDPTIVRFIFVALVLMSFGWGLLIYIILGIVMPEEKLTPQTM